MKIQNTNRRSKLSMLAIVLAMLAVLACAFTVAVAAENDSTGAPKTIEIGVNELTIGLSQNSDGMYQKVYDGTADVPVALNKTNAQLGIAEGDDVKIEVSAAFPSKNVESDPAKQRFTVTVTLTGADADKYSLAKREFSVPAQILPKKLTWDTTEVSTSVAYQPSAVEYSVPFALPKISGLLDADKDVVPEGVLILQAKNADATKPYVVQVPMSFGDNYIVDDLTVSVTVNPITIESIEWAESYVFPFGSAEAKALEIFGVAANGEKYLLKVEYPADYATKVGEFQIRVDVMNSNFVFSKAIDVTIKTVRIDLVQYQVSMNSAIFIGDLATAENPTSYMLSVIGDLPHEIRDQIVYTVNGKPFVGTSVYGTYSVVATLPTGTGLSFVDANGNVVTELKATLTINRASVNARGDGGSYSVIVSGKNGIPAGLTASSAIPEISKKAVKDFPNYKAYAVTIEGSGDAAYSIKIAIHNDLINNGVLPTVDDLYLYDPVQGTMVKANGDGRKVMLSQGYFEVTGLSGDGEWIFVVAPAHVTSFWLTAPGIAIIILLILALLVLLFFVGMIQRRNRAAAALLAEREEEAEEEAVEAMLEETAQEVAEELEPEVEPEAEPAPEAEPETVEEVTEETVEEVVEEISEEIANEDNTVTEELAEQTAEEIAPEVEPEAEEEVKADEAEVEQAVASAKEEALNDSADATDAVALQEEQAEEEQAEEEQAEEERTVESFAETTEGKKQPEEKKQAAEEERTVASFAETADQKKQQSEEKKQSEEERTVVAFAEVAEKEAEEEAEDDNDDDDDVEEGFGGFNLSGLDFIDIKDDPEGYAALLEKEKKGEIQIAYRYRRSYQSRLAQSQGRVQDYYSILKNALLSYKGVKGRISWNYEAFNKGRNHLAKMNAKTKTLYLYLALDPAELADTKYGIEDVSSKKKYASVPVLLKIKGDRKFKYALELIDKMCAEKMELPKRANAEDVDYRIAYQTTEELVEAGIVKKLAAGVPTGDSEA